MKQVKDGKRSHLSGESTEKRSILFVSSKIAQARIECEQMDDMSPEVHCNLCNHCYTLGMSDPRPDIRCV